MFNLRLRRVVWFASFIVCLSLPVESFAARDISLQPLGTYASGVFNSGAAEIVAYDAGTRRLFIVNGGTRRIDVIDARTPATPTLLFSINLAPYGNTANSVAVSGGVVAVAVEAIVKTDPGAVVFFDSDGKFLSSVAVGALPDMLLFTPDGSRVLVANEGEPSSDYTVDPEGSVSIINLARGASLVTQADVTTASFARFNDAALDPSIRIFGPRASVAQDVEPEYIAVSEDGLTAWVTLQENNALAILDVAGGEFTTLKGLGFKNHNLSTNAFDPSDRDGGIRIRPYPVFGMYQPDAIVSVRIGGETYLITANEGDARDYAAFAEEARVSSLRLDPVAFPNAATLRTDSLLGRLSVTRANGDTDGDGDYDALYVFGGRSFSVLNMTGDLVYDSGAKLERITATALPTFFNSSNDSNNSFDTRSDNKGPEPEGVTTGTVDGGIYAFIGLERIGGVMVYDMTFPTEPRFVQYVNNRNLAGSPQAGTAGDLGPEGLLFITAENSPTGKPLLVVANEVSGTTTIYEIL